MERSAWTDERLDDLAASMDTSVKLLREEIQGLRSDIREEFRELRKEFREDSRDLRADFGKLHSEFFAWQRQIAQIGWAFASALIAALVALIVATV
jgi:hypothetical protein